MPAVDDQTLSEFVSPWSFDQTIKRLSDAIVEAGMRVFAVIDHAANARDAGLQMPASTVLVYGRAEGGTPIMLASPRSALDLPLRLLVRTADDGSTLVAFHPIQPALEAMGVPAALAMRLKPAQAVVIEAIQP